LIERMRRRLAADTKFIEPCLPSPADKPPSGSNWIHEIKYDGYRLMGTTGRPRLPPWSWRP
jgi:ATP-dependent DNA ligase